MHEKRKAILTYAKNLSFLSYLPEIQEDKLKTQVKK